MPKETKATIDPTMPTTPVSAVPVAPTPTGPSNFLTLLPSSIVIALISFLHFLLTNLCCALCSLSSSFPTEVSLTSQFEISSSSVNVPDPASEAATFFTRFDLDPSDFWDAGSPYVDFHGF